MSDAIRVLFVDDDTHLLQGLKRALHKQVDLCVAETAIDGLRMLDKNGPFSVVVSDQNMPKVDGATFLAKAAQHFPAITRVMLTGNNDQGTAIAAVNNGQVFRFLNKPCNAKELLQTIRDAHAHHLVMRAEHGVLEDTISGTVQLLADMLSMAYPKAFKRAATVQRWARSAAKPLQIKNTWELDVAAMLWPLSYVMTPDALIARRSAGEPLTPADKQEIAAAYVAVAKMLQNVPRLQGVAMLLLLSCEGATDVVDPAARPRAAQLLQVLINLSFLADPERSGSTAEGFKQLAAEGVYDRALLAALPGLLSKGSNKAQAQLRSVSVFDLQAGDVLVTDLVDANKRLLLAAGQTISAPILAKISQLNQAQTVADQIRIVRPQAA
ncbi:MAG: response regulator [Pseudomonadota bacterium]